MGLENLAALFDRQNSPMVGQRMDQNRRVLARLDDLIEIADRAAADRLRQRTVDPYGFIGLDKKTPDQIAAGQILMAGDRDELVGSVGQRGELMRHVLDEARLAASGRPLQQDRQ